MVRAFLTATAFCISGGLASAALGQTYPAKSIRLVVSTPSSSPIDILCRVLGERLGKELGASVFVENKPGGLFFIGPQDVLKQPADGYTLMAVMLPMTVTPAMVAKPPFDLAKDFDPIGQTAWSYTVLIAPPTSKVMTVRELESLLKARPGQMNYASGGNGSPSHVAGELFLQQTGTQATHVPYSVFTQALADMVAGVNDFMFVATPPVIGLIKAGKMKPLAVTSTSRIAALADVPTMIESGYPDFVVRDWQGLVVRHGAPREVVTRLNGLIGKIVTSDSMKDTFTRLGADPAHGSPEDFGRLIASELARWGKVVKTANIKAD